MPAEGKEERLPVQPPPTPKPPRWRLSKTDLRTLVALMLILFWMVVFIYSISHPQIDQQVGLATPITLFAVAWLFAGHNGRNGRNGHNGDNGDAHGSPF